jgi:hypothetical protein
MLQALVTREFKRSGPAPSAQALHLVIERFPWSRFYRNTIAGLESRKAYQQWRKHFPDAKDFKQGTDPEVVTHWRSRADSVREAIGQYWLFFIALYHTLQEGENPLSATDAFHLGLIDEVLGLRDILTERQMLEYVPDAQ